jgi:hypothetical protein
MQLASFQPPGAWNFKVVPRFLENVFTVDLMSNGSWYYNRIFICSVNWALQLYYVVDNTDFAKC